MGTGPVLLAQARVAFQFGKRLGEITWVVVPEVECRVSPKLMKDGDVIHHESATRECGLERRQSKGLISRGSHVYRGLRVKLAKLFLRFRAQKLHVRGAGR